ncbi:kinesin-like protein KIF19 [Neomonachus schauinslandi]|uniref:Kinesin-like protein KIF19 n=1 Tax=Neomonachus schauinslandi TaxID=29088 RepID=A0A8M1MF77_NEOSC|nr:kinesin-like protein KIF19 [Neomonachus schauinslandi]
MATRFREAWVQGRAPRHAPAGSTDRRRPPERPVTPQAGLEQRLANAKRKALQLEKLLPTQVISEDQREVLRLLCRAHELELENTELQAGKLRRRHLLCQKDFVIQRHHQHWWLCEQLIHDLWQLIQGMSGHLCAFPGPADGGIPVPKALDRAR